MNQLRFLLFILTLFFVHSMSAQSIKGEYRLRGIPETASGFRFSADGRFDFFFIYGAVDRNASGTYTVEGDTIKLHSDKEPGKDFPITSQQRKGNNYTIKVSDANVYLLRNVIAIYFNGDTREVAYSDDDGIILINEKSVDTIYLRHELFPDIPSLIKDKNNENNYFEVSLSPSLGAVSFKGIDLAIDGKALTCLPNYFMPFENITYVKEK